MHGRVRGRMARDTGAVVSCLGALGVAGCGFEKGPETEDRDDGLWKMGEGGKRLR